MTHGAIIAVVAVALVGAAVWLGGKISERSQRKRRRLEAKTSWGRPRAHRRTLEDVAVYHYEKRRRDGAHGVDARTWADLDLDALFGALDRCSSSPGAQLLYQRLRTPTFDEDVLRAFDARVEHLGKDRALGEALVAELAALDSDEAFQLPHLFFRPLPRKGAAALVYRVLPFVALGLTLVSLVHPAMLLIAGCSWGVNAVLHVVNKERLSDWILPFRRLNTFLSAAEEISRIGGEWLAADAPRLAEDLRTLHPLRRKTAALLHDPDAQDPTALIHQYLNMFFLVDLNAFIGSLAFLTSNGKALERVFDVVGALDVALAVGSFRAETSGWSKPSFIPPDAKSLDCEGLFHPLLEEPVANTLQVERSILVTGSNMSGKSTFLRTVGVNAICAQSIYTTFAARYRAPMLKVLTSIGRADSLLEGKSYYLAEVERVRELLEASGSEVPRLFVIDEIFRGTNTIERISAARAALHHLDRGRDLVLVATHDIELIPLLGRAFVSCHFRELIEQGELRFDYRLQPGPSSTRNAIALLELLRFPPEVVREASETAQAMESGGRAGMGVESVSEKLGTVEGR